jgi:flagellar basal-body rod protein FlgC
MADIFSIVGSALDAQNRRMSVIASNLANVDSVTPPGGTSYRAHEVVFQAAPLDDSDDDTADSGAIATDGFTTDSTELGGGSGNTDLGVRIAGTVLSNATPAQNYDPGNPYADANGYVTGSNVSQVGQMVDLIDASNSYAASVAVLQQAGRVDQQMLSSFEVS